MSYITNHPKRVISGLTTVLVAAGVAVGSGASFTATTANPANVFTAGTLTAATDRAGAILTANNMKPGDTQVGVVKIRNTGSLAGTFTLSEVKSASVTPETNFVNDALTVKVEDITAGEAGAPVVVNNEPVGKVVAKTFSTPFASDETRTYKFTVKLNSIANDDANQNKTVNVTYKWDAVTGAGGTSTSTTGQQGFPASDTRTVTPGNTAVTTP